MDLVDVDLVEVNARAFEMPKSNVLKRRVWKKILKGQTMVRKLVMWATNKQNEGWPAFVLSYTDFSPGRKTPLERDIRVSNSELQMNELWEALEKGAIVKGWQEA
jgi:hypothetical protein